MIRLNLVLSAVLFLTSLFSVVLAFYSMRHRASEKAAIPFFFLLMASAVYEFAYAFTLQASDVESLFRHTCYEYLGVAFIPACFIWLAISFLPNRKKLLTRLMPAAFTVSALILIAVWTNDFHHLYYAEIAVDRSGPFPTAAFRRGPLAFVNLGYYVCSMVFAITVYIRRARDTGGIDWNRMILMIVAFVSGIAEQLVLISGIVPWNIDIGPFFLLLIDIFMVYGILSRDLFDLRSLARKMVFNAMDEGVLVILPDREIIDWNPAVFQYFPSAERRLAGKHLDSVSTELATLCERLDCGSSGEIAVKTENSVLYVSVDMIRISGKSHARAGAALILRDITEGKERLTFLEELAIRDGLTGIFNRRHWISLAETEFIRSKRNNRAMSVVMIDVDHFKRVNDSWGHAMGDSVLKAVTESLLGVLRVTDSLGRVGGEEFAIILPETDLDTASRIAERLRSAAEAASARLNIDAFPITISLGVTSLSPDDLSFSTMLKRADDALYRAKENGRNRVELTLIR